MKRVIPASFLGGDNMRLDASYQERAIRMVNELGYNPFDKAIDSFDWEDLRLLHLLYDELH